MTIGSFSSSATGKSGWSTGSLGDLSSAIPGIGIPVLASNDPEKAALFAYLGGGIRGRMPQPVVDHDNSDTFARTRFTLRNSWNTSTFSGSKNPRCMITPFRAVNNAGDLLCRQSYSCGGPCQTFQSRPGMHGLRQSIGANSTSCRADIFWNAPQLDFKTPPSTCNGKYVYDSSDYIRFRRNQASNYTYNDRSFGGDDYKGSQVRYRAVRRY